MTRILNAVVAAGFALALSAACSSSTGGGTQPFVADPEPEGGACSIEGSERFLPIATGVQWTVRTTNLETELAKDKVQVVGALEDIGGVKAGIMGFRVTTTKDTGDIVIWQEDTGTAVVRHKEEDRAGRRQSDDFFFEHKARLDESRDLTVEGTAWTETFTIESTDLATGETIATPKEYDWAIARYGEEVTVPAGTFCTLQITRTTIKDGVIGKTKQYWYAPGIGKVKERNGNRREELIEYSIP